MSGLQNDWYVAGADGEANGPLARVELARRYAAGTLPRDALAWHADHAEWLPLARVVAGLSAATAGPAPAPAPARKPPEAPRPPGAANPKPPRGERRPSPPPVDDRAARGAREARQVQALRERLAASTAAAGAAVATARSAGGRAASEAKADAAQSAQRVQQAMQRLLARAVDVLVVGVPAAAIGWGLFTGGTPESLEGVIEAPAAAFLAWLALFVLVPLETAMVALAGTTPGKALLGLRVAGPRGKPGFGAAWGRATTVLWRGVGLGILPLTAIAIIAAGVQLLNEGVAPWDRAQGLSTRAEPMDNRRWQLGLAAVAGGLVLLAGGLWGDIAVQLAAAVAAQ